MKERLALSFPLILSAVLPMAGLVLALVRLGEGRRTDAGMMAAAAVLGACVWALVLTA
jgi:hypothetical protein